MRSTMLPPWLRVESHEHKQLNTLPKCMRPEGDGAKRPTTGVGAAVAGASAACVAMLHALISMRTSIARGAVGETLPWPASCRGRALRVPDHRLDSSIAARQPNPSNDRNPGSSSQLPGFPRKRGT